MPMTKYRQFQQQQTLAKLEYNLMHSVANDSPANTVQITRKFKLCYYSQVDTP